MHLPSTEHLAKILSRNSRARSVLVVRRKDLFAYGEIVGVTVNRCKVRDGTEGTFLHGNGIASFDCVLAKGVLDIGLAEVVALGNLPVFFE